MVIDFGYRIIEVGYKMSCSIYIYIHKKHDGPLYQGPLKSNGGARPMIKFVRTFKVFDCLSSSICYMRFEMFIDNVVMH